MDVIFNQELFDRLSTSQIENLVDNADEIALEKMVFLYNLIQVYRSRDSGLRIKNLPQKKVVPLRNDSKAFAVSENSLLNEKLFDSFTTRQLYGLIVNSNRSLLKRIRDLGGFAKDELDERRGIEHLEKENFGCSRINRFRGNWIEDLTCGDFQNWEGFLIFRPNKGLVLYHASQNFKTGDPMDMPFWMGSYDNSVHYIGEDGYMNIFRLKSSPKLIVLSDVDNVKKIMKVSSPEEREAIMTVTGVGNRNLSKTKRGFGCKYEDKDPDRFSRFSSRREDMIMANAVCSIPGIDGYILPQLNYCSSGVTYREGKPRPAAKRMYGEIMMCEASKFVERVVDPAIECVTGEPCDLTQNMWRKEFEKKK